MAERGAGDQRTADDLVAFLRGFLRRFPQYSGRPFWVTGESYGARPPTSYALRPSGRLP